MTPDLNFYEGFTRISTFRKSKPSTSLCRPKGLLKKGKEKRKKLGASFFRGAYATIAIIVSPFGLFGKERRAKSRECFPIF